jgi:hypothetical protein
MGMFDDVTCEMELPGLGNTKAVRGQTKDLFSSMVRLTITKDGRLVEHRRFLDDVDELASKNNAWPVQSSVLRDYDLEYHGDFAFCCSVDDELQNFVARFVDGRVAWIKPLKDFAESLQNVISLESVEGTCRTEHAAAGQCRRQ